ncbi:MAG: hypothetical protein KDA84_21255, partial [Planctomycetaceae bacterium]|nr:hypothetical protein [Planctomycetaceae bacterium]
TTIRFSQSELKRPPPENFLSDSPTTIHEPKTEVIQPQDGWVTLLPCVDTVRDLPPGPVGGGHWRKLENGLRSPVQQFARIRVPLALPLQSEYQIRAQFARLSGSDSVNFYLPVGSRQVLLVIDGFGGKGLSGLQAVKNRNDPIPGETGVGNFHLDNGVRYTVDATVKIRENQASIHVRLGGQGSFQFEWTGPIGDLSLIDSRFTLDDTRVLGLGAWESEVQFYELTFRTLRQNAQWTRPPWVEVTPPEGQ